ncbi:MAG: RIP metalloprotease RseP [Planctomycetota bacterium]
MDSLPDILRIAQVALGIGLVIFVHELGHFIAARMNGVKVDVFSIGMGPRVFGWHRGETLYQLALIPIGGYVRMAGEDRRFDGLPPEPGDLSTKSVGARFVIYSGGVLMNIAFGLVVFPLVLYSGVPFPPPVLGDPLAGGPAWQAGLEPGTEVLSVNGQEVFDFMHIPTAVALGDADATELVVREPDGRERTVRVKPRYSEQMGMRTIDVTMSLERDDAGRAVLVVQDDSPAAEAGLRSGDRLVSVEGGVPGLSPLDQFLIAMNAGDEVRVTVADDAGTRQVSLSPTYGEELAPPRIGITPPYHVVAALRDGAEERVPLSTGDRVDTVGGTKVRRLGDLHVALLAAVEQSAPASVPFAIERDGRKIELTAEVASRDDALALADDIALKTDFETTAILTTEGEPASLAGLRDDDRILQVNGVEVAVWDDVRSLIQEAARRDEVVRLQVERLGTGDRPTFEELIITPAEMPMAFYGVNPRQASYVYRADGLAGSVRVGALCSWRFAQDAFLTLKRWMTADVSAKNFGGIISIGAISYSWAEAGWQKLFFFLCMLSINLAILNVLPIPLLDGGHLFFLIVEKIKGSPVSEKVLVYSQMVGLVLILSLLIYITYQDLVRWVLPAG